MENRLHRGVHLIRDDKQQLRTMIKRKRDHLGTAYCEKIDSNIAKQVVSSMEYKDADTIFCYVSTVGEVNTFPILKAALQEGKKVCVPKCGERGKMSAFQIKDFADLQQGKFGILEPDEQCISIMPEEIDLVLVPCLACDEKGNRIGYGGGYYDRYLRQGSFIKMSLCRNCQMLESIPAEDTDCRMDMIVNEDKIIKCAVD